MPVLLAAEPGGSGAKKSVLNRTADRTRRGTLEPNPGAQAFDRP
jgi:hypothetical protein